MASDDPVASDDPDESSPGLSDGGPSDGDLTVGDRGGEPGDHADRAEEGVPDDGAVDGPLDDPDDETDDGTGGDRVAAPTVLESSADLLARMSGGDDDGLDVAPVFRRERPRLLKARSGRTPSAPVRSGGRRSAPDPAPAASDGGYRVRRVRRLVRHLEPWSVLKVCLVFYLCVWGLLVIATRMLWSAAEEAGTIAKVETFIEELFALETFTFDSEQIFRIFVLGGLVLVVGGIGVTVVLVILFNLISDLTGGIRFTMVEEETAVRQRRLRRGDVVLEAPESGAGPPPGVAPGE